MPHLGLENISFDFVQLLLYEKNNTNFAVEKVYEIKPNYGIGNLIYFIWA